MVKRLVAVLSIMLAAPAVAWADADLHSCGTAVDKNVGRGWCEGKGTFRLVVACEDGKFARSPWITLSGGRGTLGVSCNRSDAIGAEIDVAS
jgi:hypothetical protein